MDNSFSSLHPVLQGENPDSSFSEVPYEKGFQLLYYMESLIDGTAPERGPSRPLRDPSTFVEGGRENEDDSDSDSDSDSQRG